MTDYDDHYPTVEVKFLRQLAEESQKMQGSERFGDTTIFIMKGNKPISLRNIIIRDIEKDCIDFMAATALAYKAGLMGQLLQWLETNRNWKDGGYFE